MDASPPENSTSHRSSIGGRGIVGWLALGLLALAAAGRLLHLDADPSFPTWIGYVADEGRWNETARNLVLFNDADVNWLSRLHLFMSPGYQAVNYALFRLFGVDYVTARVFSAVCGVGLLLVFVLAFRRHAAPLALAFGVVVLGVETNVFWLSRMALPEVPAAFGTLLAFLLLVRRTSVGSAVVAGLVAVGAIAMKAPTVLVLTAFPVIALLVPRSLPVRARALRAVVFLAGLALPIVALAATGFALGVLKADLVAGVAGRLLDFLALTGPYEVLVRFFDMSEFEARNLMLLGAWFTSWLWLHAGRRAPSAIADLYIASGAWAGWWLVAWSVNAYLPGRYLVHFVVPATLHIVAGLSIGERDVAARIAASLSARTPWRRALPAVWLVLPGAVVLSSVAAAALQWAGWPMERLVLRLTLVLALTIVLALTVLGRHDERTVRGHLLFPVAMTLLWLVARELGVLSGFWSFRSGAAAATWIGAAAVTSLLCFGVGHARAPIPTAAGPLALSILAGCFLAQAAPAVVRPTYSVRDASRDLARYLPATRPVRTVTAASMFLENDVKYRELSRHDQQLDGVVVFEYGGVARRFLASERAGRVVRVRAYPLTVSARYRADDGQAEAPLVGVYRAR